jgi:hypothetical protein
MQIEGTMEQALPIKDDPAQTRSKLKQKQKQKQKQIASFYPDNQSPKAPRSDSSTIQRTFARLARSTPPEDAIKRVRGSRYASSAAVHDLALFSSDRFYATRNLELLQSCLVVPDNTIILLGTTLELCRVGPSVDHIIMLLHSTRYSQGHWCTVAFLALHSDPP